MNSLTKKSKIITFIGVFILFSLGRTINLMVLNNNPILYAISWSVFYGIFIAFLFYFIVDIVLVQGLLQIKIKFIRILLFFIGLIIILNQFIITSFIETSYIPLIIESILAIILYCTILVFDFKMEKKENYLINKDIILPKKYKKHHPIKTILETVFRLFPYPEPIGLYKIGNPNKDSIVLVTGNYDLTIRRVVKSLLKLDIDCWLLVCDSKGINIWCSSLANNFNSNDIIYAINKFNLIEKINHKKLIIPQLCAGNISIDKIKNETGFICKFGPININNIKEYLLNSENPNIRRVTFNLKERIEIAIEAMLIPITLTIFIFNFIGLGKLFVILPVLYILCSINAITFPYRFIKNIRLWSLFCGSLIFGLSWIIFSFLSIPDIWTYIISISIGIIYSINEFESWSPLVKFHLISLYKKASIEINQDKCIGCGRCVILCPKGVYEINNKKSQVINLDECISCKSCIFQCPNNSIEHSAKEINESFI